MMSVSRQDYIEDTIPGGAISSGSEEPNYGEYEARLVTVKHCLSGCRM